MAERRVVTWFCIFRVFHHGGCLGSGMFHFFEPLLDFTGDVDNRGFFGHKIIIGITTFDIIF